MAKNLFKMSKTLSLALEPLPETAKKLEELKKIESDFETNTKIEKAKTIIDRFHLAFINECLAKMKREISWTSLFEAMYNGDEATLKNERVARIKAIQQLYNDTPGYEYITTPTPSKMMVEKLVPENPNEPSLLIQALYLQPFHLGRQVLYGYKKGSLISRILYDNLPIYVANAKAWNNLKEKCPEKAAAILEALDKEDITENIETLFTADGFSRCLTQKGIETYNTILKGFSDSEGIYHFGISKMVNDLKADKEIKALFDSKEWPVFNKLQKMILQDTNESFSFIPKQFGSDQEMFEAIHTFYKKMTTTAILGTVTEGIDNLTRGVVSPEEILIFKDRASVISNDVYGKWNVIELTLQKYSEEHFKTKAAAKKFNAEKLISIAQLQEIMKIYDYDQDIFSFWAGLKLERDLRCLETATLLLEENLHGAQIKDKKELLPPLESAFSNLSGTISKICMLLGGKISKKQTFENTAFKYMEDEVEALRQGCHFLFNTSRSWCTRKPYSTQKIEMNFGFPSFGDGFAESVIQSKGCMIFRKEKEYFFGILNSANKPKPEELYINVDESSKMYCLFSYSLRAMSITRILFSKANKKLFTEIGLNDEIIEGYEKKKYKDDPQFLAKLIGLTIDALHTYPSWKKIAWNLGEPEDYKSWKEFSDTVSEQAVTIEMHQCNEDTLNEMVSSGRMFLFKITSHGMKKYEKGVPTKDKMSEFFIRAVENVDREGEARITLLNNCSVFYRPASIKNPFMHRKGDTLVDKKDVKGNPIPGSIYKEIFHYYNSGEKNINELSAEARRMINAGLIITKAARFDIIKDRRFTKDMFMLHIPVTVNSDASLTLDSDKSIDEALEVVNNEANKMYQESENVIGVTRGANHLVSYCVVNRHKGILEEGDFDIIYERDDKGQVTESMNYKDKFDQINASRTERAKTWQERGDIAGIQDGYLKSVIREVIALSEKYQAIIALEDMTVDICAKSIFSRIEAASYKKFEANLLDSLSCYIPDKTNPGQIVQYSVGNMGGRYNSGQNGRVVFVSTARLQNTDPVTGFCNLFGQCGELETKEKISGFFAKFKTIEAKDDAVEMTFSYSDFGINDLRGMNNDWKIKISGDRFSYELDENDKRNRRILVVHQPAVEMIDLLHQKNQEKATDLGFKELLTSKDMKAEELKRFKTLFFLGLRSRLCATVKNEEIDRFVSVACDSNNNTFESGLTAGYPRYTDTVLAYNIAKKI